MSRRAFTLMEMLVTITVGSVAMAIAVSMLYTIMRVERNGREHVAQTGVLARLVEQFRDDMAAAVLPVTVPNDSASQWQFTLPDHRTATYRFLPGEVQRDECEDNQNNAPLRHESYRLAADQKAAIVIDQKSNPTTAELVVSSESTPARPACELRFAARLGKDHRFTPSAAGSQ